VHVDGVDLVIHVDPPAEHKAYLHRSGRTARAGAEGDVVTICLPEQRRDLADLLRKAMINVTPKRVNASSEEVVALIGEVAAYVKPVAPTPEPQGGGRSNGRNAQRKRALKESGNQANGSAKRGPRAAGQSGGQSSNQAAGKVNRNRQRSR